MQPSDNTGGMMEEVHQAMAASGSAGAAYSSGKMLAIFGAIGGAIMAIIVMTLTPPKTHRETAAALISTLVFAVCGSAAVKAYFGIHLPDSLEGDLTHAGLAFICGAPGWVLVKAFFSWAHGKTMPEIIRSIKGWIK